MTSPLLKDGFLQKSSSQSANRNISAVTGLHYIDTAALNVFPPDLEFEYVGTRDAIGSKKRF